MQINLRVFIIFLLLNSVFINLNADCGAGEKQIIIDFQADPFPWENSYEIRNQSGRVLLDRGFFFQGDTLYTDTLCVPADECLTLIFQDFAQDGLGLGGSFKVYVNGNLEVDFSEFSIRYQFHYLDCISGSICNEATSVTEGTYQIDQNLATQWYSFQPAQSGIYKISTCYPENLCNTTISGFDFCNPLNEDQNIQGTLFFNDNECLDLAEITVNLLGGKEYFLKIGSSDFSCNKGGIKWSVEFEGLVSGCMDSLACNYNPIATNDDGSCKFAGDPDCPAGPDLAVSQITFERSMRRDVITNQEDCFRTEGCLKGYGPRTVIRFDTRFDNIGETDYFIGVPPANTSQVTSQWEFDDCHQHWHYEGYAAYLLFDQDGNEIPIGFKNGFCVIDLDCSPGHQEKYTCELQGLSVGCSDTYDYYLDCQWIDITDLEDGIYTFVQVVNWDHSPDALGRYETDYTNNWAQVCINVFTDTAFNYTGYELVNDCPTYFDCLGIPNGTATPDCEGNCNGSSLTGDINKDGARDLTDVMDYVHESFDNSSNINDCKDLTADGKINIWDAALILECSLHEGQAPQPGHGHSPCEFPFNVTNPFDSVWLGIGEVNGVDGYVDILYKSPYGKMEGFQFTLEGLEISSVQSLISGFNVSVFNNENELLGLSYEETTLPKTIEWEPFLRVFVEQFYTDTICIESVEGLINENLETMILAGTECGAGDVSSTTEIRLNQFASQVVPNPFSNKAKVVFENIENNSVHFVVYDVAGKEILKIDNQRGGSIEISNSEIGSGLFIYKIVKGQEISTGKFIVK